MAEARQTPQHLRVAAIWGDTVLASCILGPKQVFDWVKSLGLTPPELEQAGGTVPQHVPAAPIRRVGGTWELDPRGAIAGHLQLRGRQESIEHFARTGSPVGLLPGDVALLQYGAFSLFAQPVVPAPPLSGSSRPEPWFVLAFFLSATGHGGLAYALAQLATPTPIPEPLELLSDRRLRDELHAKIEEEPEDKPKPTVDKGDNGEKNAGMADKKDSGGGKKITGAEGKLGKTDGKGDTKLPGETPGVPAGSMADVLGSGAGAALSDTLKSMASVAAITGGLKKEDLAWGGGSGFGLKGGGPGGGGTGKDKGVPYGSGGMATGVGPGSGGGGGKGTGGGPGGKGTGGPGGGGGPGGEKKIAMVSSGGGSAKNFSADEIRRVVNSHMGQIRACYESGLDGSPGLRGSVSVSWHIGAAGGVPRATVASSTLSNGRVEGCITRVVKGWTFRNPDGVEADASWGFAFSPP